MITKATVKQLGKKYDRIIKSGEQGYLVRHILQDGTLIDENGKILSEAEVKRVEEENKELAKKGGKIINLIESWETKDTYIKKYQ